MGRIIYDSFTEGSNVALTSHSPDIVPASEAWAMGAGSMQVNAANDHVTITSTQEARAGLPYAMTKNFEVSGVLDNLGGTPGSSFVYPALNGFLSTAYAGGEAVAFSFQVQGPRYRLAMNSTNDGNQTNDYSVGLPGGPVTMTLRRVGGMYYGLVDGIVRCSLDLSATTDFSNHATLYPGIMIGSFAGGIFPSWDDFSVYEPDMPPDIKRMIRRYPHLRM